MTLVDVDADEQIQVRDDTGRTWWVSPSDRHAQLGNVLTVHKFQGSESPMIILLLDGAGQRAVLDRAWLYTAASRAKDFLWVLSADSTCGADFTIALQGGRAERVTAFRGHIHEPTDDEIPF